MNRVKGKNKPVLPSVIKVAIVDDHNMFRAGIISLLKDFEEIKVVIEASDGKELLTQLRRQTPHVVLLDIEMPGMNGIETTAILREKYPSIRIIVLTMHTEDEFIFEMVTKGAHAFVPKNRSVEEVVDAIYAVMEAGRHFTERITSAVIRGSQGLVKSMHLPLSKLTEKETEVLRLVCRQKTNKEIAGILGISIRTVETHRNAILVKTGTKNTAGLVIYALKHKLISTFGDGNE